MTTGLDTNVLVRFLVGDDAAQLERAARLIARNEVFVARTVLLETEWVLRACYGLSEPAIARLLTGFCGLDRVTVEEEASVAAALRCYAAGMDFADALHLHAPGPDRFATFDRDLRKRAGRMVSGRPVLEL